ncbi:PREDICTED: zinc finger MYM-type protein 1-like [Erythranthe guttata]|uniref:zinc finger MYM-type protein 1-like n=1 Tax=Erythranthe guttata TaxID=4155 RepID=UPI00064E14BA|nr:PREDICTED: zinc finger MYM-type protein 1-like [Erythranthe guttata]|eukprot:XP_012851943.1 PREDICTED: zinc finger MYM-type protein 1-like [Erythranthe guttata]
MDRFVIKTKRHRLGESSTSNDNITNGTSTNDNVQEETQTNVRIQEEMPINDSVPEEHAQGIHNQSQVEVNLSAIEADPGLRLPISDLAKTSKELEIVRRAYLQKGPCQPRLCKFPQTTSYGQQRKFIVDWYNEFGSWLEYSESKDAVYCLCCYLFKVGESAKGGGGKFVSEGYRNWYKKENLRKHEGNHDSVHHHCYMACQDLMNNKGHIDVPLESKTKESKRDYYIRLRTTTKAIRYLLRQGLAFRGHDESKSSLNKGNFVELIKVMAEDNDEINKVVLDNSQGNCIMTAPEIQKQIIGAFAHLVSKTIISDIGDDFFALLVDEARDVSIKEQMAVALRYVNKGGKIIERFLGIVHVPNTTSRCLKASLESLLTTFGLSLSRVRGQGYDGASNMQGEFNGLKSLILKENKSAFYVHCFAHQLQLALVQITKKNKQLSEFFGSLALLANVIGGSCKRQELLREKQFEKLMERVSFDNFVSGSGLNQESTLKRPGDTRWNSYYFTITSMIKLFPSVVGVLEYLENNSDDVSHCGQASMLLRNIVCFEFAFVLHLMRSILGITNDLSQALQRKDQDLANAMKLVIFAKDRLQELREGGWDDLLRETSSFCVQNNILIPNMNDDFVLYSRDGRVSRKGTQITNLNHYKVDVLYTVIDLQLSELNDRFDNTNTELLSMISCFDPSNSFSAFDRKALVKLAEFYPEEFDDNDLVALENQLENYIRDVKSDQEFSNMSGASRLAEKLVAKRKNVTYPLVYLLLKLSLILPVATASVERIFSAMKIVKLELRNRMGDQMLNDVLVSFIEKDILNGVSIDEVMNFFQEMGPRRKIF